MIVPFKTNSYEKQEYFVFFSFSLFAQNYVVSGAGSIACNGTYSYVGEYNDRPFYQNNTNSDYLLLYGWGRWFIAEGSYDDMGGTYDVSYYWIYYESEGNTMTPPSTGWNIGEIGELPIPNVNVDGKALYYSNIIFFESENNDSKIQSSFNITYNGFNDDTFSGTTGEDFIKSSKVSIENLPVGLTLKLIKKNNLEIEASFNGTSQDDTDVNNLTITFNNTAFSQNDASEVINAVKNDLQINFRNLITVGSEGCDFTTINLAMSSASDYDILLLRGETFTASGMTIDKMLIFIGQGAENTIIQASETYNTATSPVFTIADGKDVVFKNLTIRYGKNSDHGGAIKGFILIQ